MVSSVDFMYLIFLQINESCVNIKLTEYFICIKFNFYN